MEKCNAYVKNIQVVKNHIRSLAAEQRVTGSTMKSVEIAEILQGFASVYQRLDDPTKNMLEKSYKFKEGATDGVNDIISTLTKGRVKDLDGVLNNPDPFFTNRMFDQIKYITTQIVRMSKNPRELQDYAVVDSYRAIIKGAHWANRMGMFTQKALSGNWMGIFSDQFDGIMLNKDFLYKQNPVIGDMYAESNEGFKGVEGRTTKLKALFDKNMANPKALSDGMTVETVSSLMKYYDQSYNENPNDNLDMAIKGLLDTGKLPMNDGEDEKAAINRYKNHMTEQFSSWKVFNYGVKDPDTQNYYKNWDEYQNSYVYHIIKSGVDYVSAIEKSIDKGNYSYAGSNSAKDFIRNLSDNERQIITLFGSYLFKDDEARLQGFNEKTGLNVNLDEAFHIRNDYVPYLMNDSMKQLFKAGRVGGMTFADMLAERREHIADNANSGLVQNFITDLESYRAMMNQSYDKLFTRSIKFMKLNNDFYSDWSKSQPWLDRQFQIHADNTLKFDGEDSVSRSSTKIVELVRQTAMALLALQSAVTLMGGGPKNIIQGVSTLMMNVSTAEIYEKTKGSVSISESKKSNEVISDTTMASVAEAVENIASNSITGRRAEVSLYDANGETMEANYAKALQGVFNFVEKANMYGMMTPFLGALPKTAKEFFANNAVTSNAGSELWLRNYRKHEIMSIVGYEFSLDKAVLDSKLSDPETEAMRSNIMKKWSKSNYEDTVRNIINEHKAELYEKDSAYFGNFGPDTKPIWASLLLRDGETIAKVMMGFAAANWYTFRQAGNFGLMTGVMATARAMGEGSVKGLKTTSPIAMPMATMGMMLLDCYNTITGDEDKVVSPFLSGLNQMQDAGLPIKALALLVAPMFNMSLNDVATDEIIKSLSRYGGGMLAGKTVESITQDMRNDLVPLSTMMQSIENYGEHLPEFLIRLASAKSLQQFKEAKDYANSAYQITFPAIDNIAGGNNDVIRLFVNGLVAGKATFETLKKDDKSLTLFRNEQLKKLISEMTGYNVFNITSGGKLMNKRVADAQWDTYLMGMSEWNKFNQDEETTLFLDEAYADQELATKEE